MLDTYLRDAGLPTDVASITNDQIRGWRDAEVQAHAAATANVRFRAVRSFFAWVVKETGDITVSPVGTLKAPKLNEADVPVPRIEHLSALLKVVEGKTDFASRRDAALIRMYIDTGARLSEIANLLTDDVDLDHGMIRTILKGRRNHAHRLSPKTVRALDRYLAVRDRHRDAASQWLWLGSLGRFTRSGVMQTMKKRAKQAGIPEGFHAHLFRHAFAHHFLLRGGQETELMALVGWRTRTMVDRYARSAALERAMEAHKRIGFAEEL
jgi:site-specific recombinase XerD